MAASDERIQQIKNDYSERRCLDIQQLLTVLSNPIRFRILCALKAHSFTVGELVEITESQLSNISQHLKMMWIAGYITKRRVGRQVHYSLDDELVIRVIDQLETVFPQKNYAKDTADRRFSGV